MFKYVLYILRWQLSTPILWLVTFLTIKLFGNFIAVVLANLIGALMFFWIDKRIFNGTNKQKTNKEVYSTKGRAD